MHVIPLILIWLIHQSDYHLVSVYSSSRDGERLIQREAISFDTRKKPVSTVISIDDKIHYQPIDGFGASFNEAGMICLNSLAPSSRDSVLRVLFDPEKGAGYSLMKSPTGACDFASAGPWYTYNDTPGDTLMKHFSINRDLGPNGLIPFIKQAGRFGNFEIEAPMDFAPDWMYYGMQKKSQKNIKPEYYSALADYYIKYLEAYSENGVSINNLVLFNESACDTCESHGYSTVPYKDIGLLIHNYVVPRLKAHNLKTKIILGERCFRYSAIESYPVVLDNPAIRPELSRVAVHGYDFDKYSSIAEFREKYPDIPIWMTEICYVKPPVYEFSDGEYWGNMIMNDINSGVSGWIYWNMILDQDGGPWLTSPLHGDPDNNHQHPVVIINRETGKVTYTGLYYYLAHFSKFIRPGACRIKCEGGNSQLNFAGFLNKDGSIVVNVINNGEALDCSLAWKGKVAEQRLKAHSITTIKWKNEGSNL